MFWAGFGLFHEGRLRGVVCYGQPSPPLQRHAFDRRDFPFMELTRLVVDRGVQNGASILIGRSLKLLDAPCAVVSYADSAHGHAGIVYQATNWVYTGATVSHDVLYRVGGELLQSITVRDRFGVTAPREWAKAEGIEIVKPQPKHRYFQFCGTKAERKRMRAKLKYPEVEAYPKRDKQLYKSPGDCEGAVAVASLV